MSYNPEVHSTPCFLNPSVFELHKLFFISYNEMMLQQAGGGGDGGGGRRRG
jgi:hypothetical protein